MKRNLIALFTLVSGGIILAQTSGYYPNPNYTAWYVGVVVLPTTSTAISIPANSVGGPAPALVFVDQMNFQNTTASPVSITVTDGSTNCGGSACILVPSTTIAANTMYSVPKNGEPANGGIKWSASLANAIHASIRGRY